MSAVTKLTSSPREAKRTLGICGGAHFIHDGFTDALYVLLPIWSQALGLTLFQVGLLKAITSTTLAGFQLPAGFLSERFGPRIILAMGTVVAGIGYLMAGFSGGFWALALALAVVGMGAAVQHPLSSALVASAYREGRRRAALGIYNFTGDLGKMVLPTSVALGVGLVGWQMSSMAVGAIGIASGFLIWLALGKIAATDALAREETGEADDGGEEHPVGWGMRDPVGFGLLSTAGLLDTGTRYAFLSFLPFLLLDKGAEIESVGFALSLVFAGGAAGKFACGLLAERLGIIRTVVLTELATAGGIVLLIFFPLLPALLLLPVIGVVLNGTSSVLYGTVSEFVDESRHARAFGLFYTILLTSGAIAPMAFGAIGDAMGVGYSLSIVAMLAATIVLICPFLAPRIAENPAT